MKHIFNNASTQLKLAALAIGFFVFLVACFFYPSDARPDVFYFSNGFFSLTIAMAALSFNRFLNKEPGKDDAGKFATLGMSTLAIIVLFIVSLVSLSSSVDGHDERALVLNFIFVGIFLFVWTFSMFVQSSVEDVRQKFSKQSNHSKWHGDILSIAIQSIDPDSKATLKKIASNLRYLPSDIHEKITGEDNVNTAIEKVRDAIEKDSSASVMNDLRVLGSAIEAYQLNLKRTRNKA
jgi:hypothetical protein